MSLALARKAGAWRLEIGRPLAAILVLACLWAAVSIPWAPDTWLGIRGALKLAGNLLLGAVLFSAARKLDADGRRWIAPALLFGFGLTLALLFIEDTVQLARSAIGLRDLPYRGTGRVLLAQRVGSHTHPDNLAGLCATYGTAIAAPWSSRPSG